MKFVWGHMDDFYLFFNQFFSLCYLNVYNKHVFSKEKAVNLCAFKKTVERNAERLQKVDLC